MTESLINRLEKFAGTKLKAGRNVIKGFPADIEDSDGSYIDLTVVDKDACTGLVKLLRAANFKAKRDGDLGISITEEVEGTAMNLIQELLGLNKPKTVTESDDSDDMDMSELIEKYCDQEKMYHFEGGRGVNNFEKIASVLGYRNMDYFLEDNPGCLEAMIQWLGKQKIQEWKDAMKSQLKDDDSAASN